MVFTLFTYWSICQHIGAAYKYISQKILDKIINIQIQMLDINKNVRQMLNIKKKLINVKVINVY